MKSGKYLKRIDVGFGISIIIYVVLAIILLPFYQYQINPDGISYISIAQKYRQLDFANAVNGFWGPLLSWLLIPFLKMGIEPLLSSKLLTITIGLFTLIQSDKLLRLIKIEGHSRKVLLTVLVVVMLYFALSLFTPDILMVCLTLAYLNIILSPDYSTNKFAGVGSGAVAALLFLTKSYGLPFFVVHYVLFNILFLYKSKDKLKRMRVSNNFVSGMLVFTVVSALWIFAISQKYGYFTIGSAGTYNHALVGPDSPGHPLGHPIHFMGFLAPPNNTALSAWEDISYVEFPNWSTFGSFNSVAYQTKLILNNVWDIFLILEKFSFFSIFVLLASIFYFRKKRKQLPDDPIFHLLVSLLILVSGYSLLLLVNRYLWLGIIILLATGTKLWDEWMAKKVDKSKLKSMLFYIFAASFLLLPVRNIYLNLNSGRHIYAINNTISGLGISGRVASNTNWHESLYLAFYNNWKYYGEIGKETKIQGSLQENEIDYFFVWGPGNENIEFLTSYPEISTGEIEGLLIYKLK